MSLLDTLLWGAQKKLAEQRAKELEQHQLTVVIDQGVAFVDCAPLGPPLLGRQRGFDVVIEATTAKLGRHLQSFWARHTAGLVYSYERYGNTQPVYATTWIDLGGGDIAGGNPFASAQTLMNTPAVRGRILTLLRSGGRVAIDAGLLFVEIPRASPFDRTTLERDIRAAMEITRPLVEDLERVGTKLSLDGTKDPQEEKLQETSASPSSGSPVAVRGIDL